MRMDDCCDNCRDCSQACVARYLHRESQAPEEAERLLANANDVFGELVIASPGVRSYHGRTLCNLGILRSLAGDYEGAMPLLTQARQEIERALRIDPTAADYRNYRRITANELAMAMLQSDRSQEAATTGRPANC